MPFRKLFLSTSLAVLTCLAANANETFTIQPGETKTVWTGVNVRGEVLVRNPSTNYEYWFISSGTNGPTISASGDRNISLTNKLDYELRVKNPSAVPLVITIDNSIEAADPIETIENMVGSLAGGENSEVNKAHRALKSIF